MALQPQFVDRIFTRLLARYGSAWIRAYEGVDEKLLKGDWADQLAGFAFQVVGLEIHRLLALLAARDDAGQREGQGGGRRGSRSGRRRSRLGQQIGRGRVHRLGAHGRRQGEAHHRQAGRASGRGPAGEQNAGASRGVGQDGIHGQDGASRKGD